MHLCDGRLLNFGCCEAAHACIRMLKPFVLHCLMPLHARNIQWLSRITDMYITIELKMLSAQTTTRYCYNATHTGTASPHRLLTAVT